MNYSLFRKPSRYIGNEVNCHPRTGDVKVALCFPDTYEIGMSHIGLKILYSIINNTLNASAERVYSPWTDLEANLRAEGKPLTSIENNRPLQEFDIIGFTLQYELSYTNVLNMIDLGGMAIRSAERDDNTPVLIAGGPCAVNPLPLEPFIDAFVIGDGEDIIGEIVEVYSRRAGQQQEGKSEILKKLARIEGIYVPSIHNSEQQKINRRITENLDNAPFPVSPILPYCKIVHDRIAIEISRGCTKGCRFCQAGMIYRPKRERSLEKTLSLAKDSIRNTGYEEISFTSLSTGDYSSLLPLIRNFNHVCAGTQTSVSLPSLRVGAISTEILKEIKSVRKTGFTIAPEAGTKRLRNVINKDFTEEEYEETLKKLFTEGWSTIKLYFMIGLPTETMADIDGLIDMAIKASKKGRQISGKRVNINVGISAFIPKAHTPFQWTGQDSYEELRKKQDYIRRAFKKRGINFKGQFVENSLLEAVFARGGRDSALLLENAWKMGCRFDGWSEFFDFNRWKKAADEAGLDLHEYASRTFSPDEALPWDFIVTGITKESMLSEYRKATEEKITPDCSTRCYGCGLRCTETNPEKQASGTNDSKVTDKAGHSENKRSAQARYRVKFSKTGILKYLSHQELMTSILRAMRRAAIPLAYSTGFHPHPRISFGPALPVGIEGSHEFFDIEIVAFFNAEELLTRLNKTLPDGINAHSAVSVPVNTKSLNTRISGYEYEIIIDKSAIEHINSFMLNQQWIVHREKKTVDIRPMVEKADIEGNKLTLLLTDTDSGSVRLFEVLKEMLQTTVEEIHSYPVKRTGLYSYNRSKPVCL